MRPRVHPLTFRPDTPIVDAIERTRGEGHQVYPVVDGRAIGRAPFVLRRRLPTSGIPARSASRTHLVRTAGSAGKASVEIEIITGDNPARRIAGEGERFDADVICIGSRGRYVFAKLFFGSISQEVLLRSDRPVLLVQTTQRDTRRT